MKKSKYNKGFSLVEVCIALIILSTIITPLIVIYQARVVRIKYTDTDAALNKIREALNAYVERTNPPRLPVPASLLTSESDVAHGAEGNPTPAFCNSSTWQETDGMCLTADGRVLYGAVPFQALGLSAEDAVDAWSQKIIYAVAANQVAPLTFVKGGNQVIAPLVMSLPAGETTAVPTPEVDNDGNPINYEAVIYSLGAEGRGAYSREGVLVWPCDAGLRESVNCEFTGTVLMSNNSAEGLGTRSFGNNENYYDDLTMGYSFSPSVDWMQSDLERQFLLGTGALIGIGTDNPDPAYRIHVEGDVQVRGDVQADHLCGPDDSDCFNPEIIAGAVEDMNCRVIDPAYPPGVDMGRPVLALGDQRVTCASVALNNGTPSVVGTENFVLPSSFSRQTCPTGNMMAGISPAGVPICRTP